MLNNAYILNAMPRYSSIDAVQNDIDGDETDVTRFADKYKNTKINREYAKLVGKEVLPKFTQRAGFKRSAQQLELERWRNQKQIKQREQDQLLTNAF